MANATRLGGALLALCALLALAGCPPNPGPGGSGIKPPGGQGKALKVDFRKTTVGLPHQTLDYVGTTDLGLAGAKQAGKIFYAVRGPEKHEIYVRDLNGGERAKVTEVDRLETGSLAVDPQARWLVYARDRAIESYIDAPGVMAPAFVGVLYRYDLATNKEEALFDFREGEWLRFRSGVLSPIMSHSGSRIACLTYDIDESNLMRDLDEWTARAEDYFSTPKPPAERIQEHEVRMREILNAPHVSPLLRELGLTPQTGVITAEERSAVAQLRGQHTVPKWGLLLWDNGTPSLAELQLPEEYSAVPLTLVAVGDELVLLAVQVMNAANAPEVRLLQVNTADGAVTEFATYTGIASSMSLDGAEDNVLLVYQPYSPGQKLMIDELHVRTIPVANPAGATERTLPGSLTDILDTTTDAQTLAVQAFDDHDLYVIRGDQRTKLTQLSSAIDAVYITDDAKRVVYLENGFLFGVDIVDNPEGSSEWVQPARFADYDVKAREFLAQSGFTVPANVTFSWEETEGMGLHDVSGVAENPAKPGYPALLRYSVENERFESLYFPAGYSFDGGPAQADIDAPTAQRLARETVTKLGWLSEKAQYYQPGPNPLYDGETETFVMIFRDGFMTATPDGQKFAVNGEATLRVHKPTGNIVELNLRTLPEVGGKFEFPLDQIETSVRNKGSQPLPDTEAIKIDVDGRGLVVAMDKATLYQPARIDVPTKPRLCWEVNTFIQPENELIMTHWVDVEDGDVLGQLNFLPTQQAARGGL